MEENELIPPSVRLVVIRDYAKKNYGEQKLRTKISEVLLTPSLKKFTYDIDKQKWKGFVYMNRNSLYGSIFSFYSRTPIVIRGFPKIRYSESSRVFGNEVVVEEKIDGTNIIIWLMPDGKLMGKTRQTPNFYGQGWKGIVWHQLLKETGFLDSLIKLCKEGYSPAMELYGNKNPGEFIRYSIPISIKILEITDMRTMKFLEYSKKIALCEEYDLPYPKLMFKGLLSPKKLDHLEKEAEKYLCEDGMEGFVAKYFDPYTKDVHMGKIKSKQVREKCWGMSPRKSIPRVFIAKAIKKAIDEHMDLSSKESFEFIKKELLEDFEESNVERSISRIVRSLELKMIDMRPPRYEDVHKFLTQLEKEGIEVSFDNKSKVLNITALEFPEFSGRVLFRIFCNYVVSME